jgi:hypothetical protein
MEPSHGQRFAHPLASSLNFAIFLAVASSILVGYGISWLVHEFQNVNTIGVALWLGLTGSAGFLSWNFAVRIQALAQHD